MAYAPAGGGRARTLSPDPIRRQNGGPRGGRPGPKAVAAPARRVFPTFLASLGIGLAIGAAAALLLAPQSGAATRQALRNRGKRVRNKATDAWDDLRLELLRTRRAIKRKRRDATLAGAAAAEDSE